MTVELDLASPISSYTIVRAAETPVGTADFVVIPGASEERIFFHTEVCQDFGGRDLVALLVSKALTDSIRKNVTVVPLCPMFARHLRVHGDEFVAHRQCDAVKRRQVPPDIRADATRFSRREDGNYAWRTNAANHSRLSGRGTERCGVGHVRRAGGIHP
ncbi:GNAT family N-acetyltransferase [Streptomyces sp. NPDC059679]|uniref:GNAT family N-acetyltransferase n=1 Tax=Streptomyces sp. NPDC059679 TaxID=3346903 RepID=UPI00367ED48E